MTKHFFFLILLLMTIGVKPAFANPEQDSLRSLMNDLLSYYQTEYEDAGWAWAQTGTPVIEPRDGYYAVTLPALNITTPRAQIYDIGLIALNIAPTDKQGVWTLSAALPETMHVKNSDGKIIQTLSLGPQKFSAIWQDDLKGFSAVNGEYKDMTLQDHQTQNTQTLGALRIKHTAEPQSKGLWALQTSLIGDDYSFEDHQRKNTLTAKSIQTRTSLKGYTPKTAETPASPQDKNDMAVQIQVSGITQNDPAQTALSPSHITLDMTVESFPAMAFLDLIKKTMPAQNTPAARQFAGLQMMITLPQLLNESGTHIALHNAQWANSVYDAALTGKLSSDPKAALGLSGQLNGRIKGMDSLKESLQKNRPDLLPTWGVVDAYSRNEGDARLYDLTLTQDGKILLNNASLFGEQE